MYKMIGAIVGDVVGSRFEFHNIKTKDFELVHKDCHFTDDTVLTIAVMDWICNCEDIMDENEAALFLQKWARKYPYAGYGGRFRDWMYASKPKPYNSCGNGAAMRISPVAYMFDDCDSVVEVSSFITGVTHNHPEGVKGAEAVAVMINMALNGASKTEMWKYATSMYPEIKNFKYEDLRRNYVHGEETCQATVPQALYCFLISTSFEDCLRTTISIGGDCDTTAAMSCAIAEAFYGGIPDEIAEAVLKKLPEDMLEVIDDFNWRVGMM